MKRSSVSASLFYENTIRIPYSRLKNFLKKGDIIRGYCYKVGLSASYVEYKVTHIDWWGVYAVPTDNMIEKMSKTYTKEHVNSLKHHFKFKWNHISGVIFSEI